jgi:hypothetical protein
LPNPGGVPENSDRCAEGNKVGPRQQIGQLAYNQDKYSVYSGYIMIIHDISIVG